MKKIIILLVVLATALANNLFAQAQFWGVTSQGGADGAGVIFKTNSDGTGYVVQKNISVLNPGAFPTYTQLLEGSPGKLYGITSQGGVENYGVLFEYDIASGGYARKLNFGIGTGTYPVGALVQVSNGKFYGMTTAGGSFGAGVLFEYDPSNGNYTKKIEFDGGLNGGYSYSGLTLASNGKLYGSSSFGGVYNSGILFEYDPQTNNFFKHWDFNYLTDGYWPLGAITQAPNGKLYGVTYVGSPGSSGNLYEFDPITGIFATKYELVGDDGLASFGSLVVADNGKLYGMTSGGGINAAGVLFQFDPIDGTFSKRIDFDRATNGALPYGALMQGPGGKLYGLTSEGGQYNAGVLFEYDKNTGVLDVKKHFVTEQGANPYGNLIQAFNGKLYGTAFQGGEGGLGVIFEYSPSDGTYTKLVDLNLTSSDGSRIEESLTRASNGNLYGLASGGGLYNVGVLFEYNISSGRYSKKVDFNNTGTVPPMGAFPQGGLTEAQNGKLYGMTQLGGLNGKGVLFEYNPTDSSYAKKLDFSTGTDPYGSLTLAENGKLYGLTSKGGANGFGILFEFDPANGNYADKFDFPAAINGATPLGSLTLANGKLYGITCYGGSNNIGALFEFDPVSAVYVKKLDFESQQMGANPVGNLTLSSNGKLYGMAASGGYYNGGTLFEYDPGNSSFNKKLDFSPVALGNNPRGSLSEGPNGKLYGMTTSGGIHDAGVLFEFDPSNSDFIKKMDLNPATGSYPQSTKLLLVKGTQFISFDSLAKKSYGNPSFDLSATASSGLPVFYASSDTTVAKINGNTITIVRAGNTIITASSPGDINYYPAKDEQQTLVIAKGNPAVVWRDPSDISYATPLGVAQLNASADVTGVFTYNPSAGTILPVGTNLTLRVDFMPTDAMNYDSIKNFQVQINVFKANQTVTFDPISNKTIGDSDFSLAATTNSSLPLDFTSNSDKVLLNGSEVSLIKGGRAVITASQGGDNSYNAATPVDQSFCINPSQPAITASDAGTDHPTLISDAQDGNQWYLNGLLIPGAINTTLSPTESGTYTVKVTADDCVSAASVSTTLIITGDLTGTSNKIEIYPNPVENRLEVSGIQEQVQSAQLYDVLGRSSNVTFERHEEVYGASVSHLSAGVYFLKLQTSTTVYQLRFIRK